MCLDNFTTTDLPQIKEAYKVFNLHNNKLFPCFYKFKFKKRKWLRDDNDFVRYHGAFDTSLVLYPAGFHCFTSKDNALAYTTKGIQVCHRVLVREIVAAGNQCKWPSIVAKEIFIMEEVTCA